MTMLRGSEQRGGPIILSLVDGCPSLDEGIHNITSVKSCSDKEDRRVRVYTLQQRDRHIGVTEPLLTIKHAMPL